jgi:hypothetical protein
LQLVLDPKVARTRHDVAAFVAGDLRTLDAHPRAINDAVDAGARSARPPAVGEQQLAARGGADRLHAGAMASPARFVGFAQRLEQLAAHDGDESAALGRTSDQCGSARRDVRTRRRKPPRAHVVPLTFDTRSPFSQM